jgi:hypothetical protein
LGKLVQFEGRGKERGAAKPEPSASAEILIFTGVRYERQDTTPPKPTASSGSKRKRG